MVAVEGRVLETLGHRRAGGLLEPRDEPGSRCAARVASEHVAEPGDLVTAAGQMRRGLNHCMVDPLPRDLVVRIGAVDVEADEQLDDGLSQATLGEVGGGQIVTTHRLQVAEQAFDLGRQQLLDRQPLAVRGHLGVVLRAPGEARVDVGERPLPGGVHEHAGDGGECVVPGCSVAVPVGRQGLAALEDRLDDRPRAIGCLA